MNGLNCRLKSHIKPFERRLALRELRALAGASPVPVDGDFTSASVFAVPMTKKADVLRNTLAYWAEIGNGNHAFTAQIRGEATVGIARNGASIRDLANGSGDQVEANLPRARCLRYATHGIHEYRGKFFPQLVRSLINIAQLPADATLLDPMCGSGTSLVEARLSGLQCYGLDINPLSVFITRVKCQALGLDPRQLVTAYLQVRTTLDDRQVCRGSTRGTALVVQDRQYLERWFAPATLTALQRIDFAITRLQSKRHQSFFRVCLSNILRGVSWQKDDDLRIRRDESTVEPEETIDRFLREAERSTRIVGAFLAERGRKPLGRYRVAEGDARKTRSSMRLRSNEVDAVITSPPYATALPYIDTDRLSLVYLGLLSRARHRHRDTQMIGNREVTRRARAEYWASYESRRCLLPARTRDLIDRIDQLNKAEIVGFRRQNLSALLARYFLDMRAVMQEILQLLRPGGVLFLVIGNNRTTAGTEQVNIETADHLSAIGKNLGFRLVDDIPMDMLVSRDIFRRNAMPSERILRLAKP